MASDLRHGGRPGVSVVIPARNAAATIGQQLAALASQDYEGEVEILVVDNESSDGTAEIAVGWHGRLPTLRVLTAGRPFCVAHARNVGIAEAAHDLLLGCDADDVAGPGWINRMVAALAENDVVAGRTIDWRDGLAPADHSLAFGSGGLGFLDSFMGCNFGLRRAVWRSIGGFDETLESCEDVDFAWRAQLAGFRLTTASDVVVYYRIDTTPSRVFRKWVHYGADQPALYARFAAAGMPRQAIHRSVARWTVLIATSYRLIVGSDDARERWLQEAGRRTGRVVGSIRHRTRFL